MFESIKENSIEFHSPNLSDFSPPCFSSTDILMRCFDPIVSLEEADMNPPVDDYDQEFFDDHRLIQAFGCLNVPVLEIDGGTGTNCSGVVEMVTTSHKVNFCKNILEEFCEPYDAVLAEIRDVLRTICNTLKLPLAQTWGPCEARSGQSINSISVIESASYVFDPEILSFFEGTSGEQLVPGEGIAGKATQMCFTDINDFCSDDYSIISYFGLNSAVAIRLRSTYTGPIDFLLEFFLPRDCKREEEQKHIRSSIISMIKHVSWSLHLINDEEPVKDMITHDESWISDMVVVPERGKTLIFSTGCQKEEPEKGANTRDESWISDGMQARERGKTVILSTGCQKEEPEEGANIHDESWISEVMQARERGENVILSIGCHKQEPEEEFKVINQFYNKHEKQTYLEWGTESRGQSLATKQSSLKSRAKTERNISLKVLQQYFPGSLKDAAKSIGVCPTTLKRICRQHGIMRWPSRKIKKVSHSLKKLQLVIDSVQGADGMITLGSFYTNFPELNSPISSIPKPKVNNRVNLLKKSQTPTRFSYSCNHGSSSSSGNIMHTEEAHELQKKKSPSYYNNMSDLLSTPNEKVVDVEVIPLAAQSTDPICKDIFKVKATYGDEKIRFRMSENWGFGDLNREISRRFDIYDIGNITIKYMDDDSEWVLLACDEDVEECLDLHASTKHEMIKLVIQRSPRPSFMSMVHPNDDIHR